MKALLYDKYGSAEVLEIREIEKPAPKKNEVLVRVHAVSVNDWDWGLVEGKGVNRMIVHIPGHADHDSEMMPIGIPGRCRSTFRRDADQEWSAFRNADRAPGMVL